MATTWKNVPPFIGKTDRQIRALIMGVTGKSIFGDKLGDKLSEKAYNDLMHELELIDTDYYSIIPSGEIAHRPNYEKNVARVVENLRCCILSYEIQRQPKISFTTDEWAKQHAKKSMAILFDMKGKKCTRRETNQSRPRFSAKIIESVEEFLVVRSVGINKWQDQTGFIAEEYILSFLNEGFRCPECGVIGQLASCGGSGDGYISAAFRDGVCLECKKNGVDTLFEIKTRNEENVMNDTYRGKLWIKAGSFVGVVSLLAHRVNVYMIILSRDTGSLRIGKIEDVILGPDEDYHYNVQEVSRMSSNIGSKIMVCPKLLKVCMPPMEMWLPKAEARRINAEALEAVLKTI